MVAKYILCFLNRGLENGEYYSLPWSVLVTDCWAAQLKTVVKERQICLAHILRDLIYIKESTNYKWTPNIIDIIHQAMQIKKHSNIESFPLKQKIDFEKQIKVLLQSNYYDSNIDIKRLRKRLLKNFDAIFCFLKYHDVPYDNNASERAIRNVKIKPKVSTGYRSNTGAEYFAIIKSVYDTIKKQGQDLFEIGGIITSPNYIFSAES